MDKTKLADFLSRTWWTAVSVFVTFVVSSPVWTSTVADIAAGKPVDVSALRVVVLSAIAATVTAVVNAGLIWLRTVLPFLATPGGEPATTP